MDFIKAVKSIKLMNPITYKKPSPPKTLYGKTKKKLNKMAIYTLMYMFRNKRYSDNTQKRKLKKHNRKVYAYKADKYIFSDKNNTALLKKITESCCKDYLINFPNSFKKNYKTKAFAYEIYDKYNKIIEYNKRMSEERKKLGNLKRSTAFFVKKEIKIKPEIKQKYDFDEEFDKMMSKLTPRTLKKVEDIGDSLSPPKRTRNTKSTKSSISTKSSRSSKSSNTSYYSANSSLSSKNKVLLKNVNSESLKKKRNLVKTKRNTY
tara:strand:+ start:4089 stop:4874 length:786 start_codon:yes stop_codon:yes gene_type:complete